MNNEIDNNASLMRQRLENDLMITQIIQKMYDSLKSETNLDKKCQILSGLGILYYLYPSFFNDSANEILKIVRNPIQRFQFLTGIKITDEQSLENFNYEIDDKDIYIVHNEILENTNFPFYMYQEKKEWLIETVSPGSGYFYNISNKKGTWKITDGKHGHNPFKYEDMLLWNLLEFLEKSKT